MLACLPATAPPFSEEVMFKLLTHFHTFKFRRCWRWETSTVEWNEMKQDQVKKWKKTTRTFFLCFTSQVAGNFQFMIPTLADIKILWTMTFLLLWSLSNMCYHATPLMPPMPTTFRLACTRAASNTRFQYEYACKKIEDRRYEREVRAGQLDIDVITFLMLNNIVLHFLKFSRSTINMFMCNGWFHSADVHHARSPLVICIKI